MLKVFFLIANISLFKLSLHTLSRYWNSVILRLDIFSVIYVLKIPFIYASVSKFLVAPEDTLRETVSPSTVESPHNKLDGIIRFSDPQASWLATKRTSTELYTNRYLSTSCWYYCCCLCEPLLAQCHSASSLANACTCRTFLKDYIHDGITLRIMALSYVGLIIFIDCISVSDTWTIEIFIGLMKLMWNGVISIYRKILIWWWAIMSRCRPKTREIKCLPFKVGWGYQMWKNSGSEKKGEDGAKKTNSSMLL